MLRLFVGLELPESFHTEFSMIQSGLPNARWVAPENLHLTLQFIGEIDEDVAEDIDAALKAVEHSAFDLSLAGMGCFESRNRARAVWLDVAPEPKLGHLHAKIEQALIHAGLPPSGRKFKPHVTLARLKRTPVDAVSFYLEAHGAIRLPAFTVDHVTLFRSHLSHSGANYEKLADYTLSPVGQ